MRKFCLFALILVFTHSFIFAGPDSNHAFSLGVSTGSMSGVTEEIVYAWSFSKDKVSQLDWQINPLFYAGLDLHYNWQSNAKKTGFFSDVNVKIGIPGRSGTMEDRDWVKNMFDEDNPTIVTYPYWLTCFSEHENHTKFAVLTDFDAGLSYQLVNNMKLKFFLSYKFMFYSWEARGGSILYPPEPESPNHGYYPSSVKVITYKQYWNIISPGVSFYGEFNRFFNIELSFKITPLIFLYSEDDHLQRTDVGVFYDYPKGGVFLEPGLLFNYRAGPRVTLSFSYACIFVTGSRGDSYYYNKKYSRDEYAPNSAGATFLAHDIGIMLKFKLF